jgi:nanoRNase/pAp phosphatase (c-di-AMP/oligoRNAs hydrolase)
MLIADDSPGGTPPSGRLLAALAPFRRLVLASHVNPDPDALASMLGLHALLTQRLPGRDVVLTLDGIIARAENQAMVEGLGIPLTPAAFVPASPDSALVLVDTQPHTGRRGSEAITPTAVLDHHETPGSCAGVAFQDIRPDIGATSTMVFEYLREQGLAVDQRLATALYYGIESETTGYPREASPNDDLALAQLFLIADKNLLACIRNPRLPQSYFAAFQHALANAFLYSDVIVCYCGTVPQPDLVSELADFFIRFDRVAWTLCIGAFEDQLKLSVRADHIGGRAGELLRETVNGLGVAGGHDRRAGGAIRLQDTRQMAIDAVLRTLRRRFLDRLGIDEQKGCRLLDTSPMHPVP